MGKIIYSALFLLCWMSGSFLFALPVQITQFLGSSDGSMVYLFWSTATEEQNYGFSVERRDFGTNNWMQRSIVLGSGTVFDPHDYSYIDTNVAPGHYEYRLVQIDTDGDLSVYAELVNVTVSYPQRTVIENFMTLLTGNIALLTWDSASELFVDGFEIQKKDSASLVWDSIGFVQGAGTTSSMHQYSYLDTVIKYGRFYYRLLQHRTDDSIIVYDSIISVLVSAPMKVVAERNIPQTFVLNQNFPNPFNPSTTIGYDLPVSGWVSLRVYNILGQQIAELVNAEQKSGHHESLWNAKSPSGMYFYRIVVVGVSDPIHRYIQQKKMILLK